jgi:hypothetical protein
MKQLPVPDVPGNTPWEKMDNAVRKIFSVSKDAFKKEETKRKRNRAKKRAAQAESR